MASNRTIAAPVGLRNGTQQVANNAGDMQTVMDLLDSIPDGQGGTADRTWDWPVDRQGRIRRLYTQIYAFQNTNTLPTPDGVVDPNGTTLRRLNLLGSANEPSDISVEYVPAPGGSWEYSDRYS